MKYKFEHIAFFILLAVLAVSLFVFKDNTDIVYLILGAFIGAFSKGNNNKKEGENNG